MVRIRTWQVLALAAAFGFTVVLGIRGLPDRTSARKSNADVENLIASPTTTSADLRSKATNVIVISIDTLRADRMGLYGHERDTTPNIDRFAQAGRVFDRAYSTSPFTSPSMVSMLTGLYPGGHGVRLLWQRIEPELVTLPDLLAPAGIQSAAVISNIVLGNDATGLGDRFAYFDETLDESQAQRPDMLERRADATTDAAIAWLDDQRDPAQPFLLWVHYIDPHCPYDPPADKPLDFEHLAAQPLTADSIPASVREDGVLDGLEYVDRYDEEIAFTDVHVGRLLDRLAESGLLESSLIVITADHGEHLMDGDGGYFSHGFGVRDAVVRIPLIIHGAGAPPGRIHQPVSICDIMPTALAAVGIDPPSTIDGRSLLGAISPRPPYVEGPDTGGSGGLQRAFVYPDRKVIVQHGRSNVPRRAWAFDPVSDPGELNPLPVDASEPAYQVLARIILEEPHPGGVPEKYRRGQKPTALVATGADQQSIDSLRTLGYVE